MNVQFLVSISGQHGSFAAGQSADVDAKVAGKWINAGYCRAVSPVERTADEKPEMRKADAKPVRRTADAKPKASRRKAD